MANGVKSTSTSNDLSTAEEWYLTVRCKNCTRLIAFAHSTVKCNGQISGAEENLARGLVAEYRGLFDVRSGFGGLGRSRKSHLMWHISPASSSCSTGERPSSRPDLRTTLGQRAQ